MYVILIAMLAMFILLGYEIRYRLLKEEMDRMGKLIRLLLEDVTKLNAEIKMKQNIYVEYQGPKKA